ncbi:MAG TPA: DUF1272 domain-containing protein [Rhizobiales bacterium]|nr:DUF1272 domain-containing protein [Hyphomicrobiales bacterium]
MLERGPNCECCDRDLPPNGAGARGCGFERTLGSACAQGVRAGTRPNCGGEPVRRPVRPAVGLGRHPAWTGRVLKAEGCPPREAA